MDCKVIHRLLLLVALFFSTQSFAIEFQGKFIQGHFIIGKTDPGTSILVDKKKLRFQRMVILLLELKRIENLTLQSLKIITKL